MPTRSSARSPKTGAEAAWSSRNSYGRSGRSALARSAASELTFWLDAIHTGAPVGSNRLRSCSRTSASVRYVTRVLGPDADAARPYPTIPYTTRPTPMAAAAATMSTIVGDIGQPVVKCQRLSTSLGPTPPTVSFEHEASAWVGAGA